MNVTCPKCYTVTPRSVWSIAHLNIEQTFECPKCGRTTILPPRKP